MTMSAVHDCSYNKINVARLTNFGFIACGYF